MTVVGTICLSSALIIYGWIDGWAVGWSKEMETNAIRDAMELVKVIQSRIV